MSEALKAWRGRGPLERALWGVCPLAIFPLMTSALISLGFLFGQTWLRESWWLAGGMTVTFVALVGGWRGVLLAGLWAGVSFFVSDILTFGQLGDYFHYHYPQTLFLERGWNPIMQPTMEVLGQTQGVALDTFRPVHTVCFPLLLAQWAAATDTVTRSLCGFVWVVALLTPAVVGMTWVTLRRWCPRVTSPWARALWAAMALLAGCRVDVLWTPLDTTCFLTQLALVSLMVWVTEAPGIWVRVGLCVVAVMLPGLKQSGVAFTAVVFAGLFTARLARREWVALRGDAMAALVVALGVGVFFFHPYATNWVAYGSPLFPAQSFLPTWQGWDITADLGENSAGSRVSLTRFLYLNTQWVMLFVVAVVLAWRARGARKWLLPMGTLLMVALLMPCKLYHYVRYVPFVPLVALFALAAIAEEKRLPRWVLRVAAGLCVAGFAVFAGWRGLQTLSNVGVALDLQHILALADERPQGLVLLSTRAFVERENSVYLRRTDLYPLRANTFFAQEVFGRRAGLTLEEQYAWDRATAQAAAEDIADVLIFVRRDTPLCQSLTPRPLRLAGLLRFPERAWFIFRHRWL